MKTFIKITVLFVACFLVSLVDATARGMGGHSHKKYQAEEEKIVFTLFKENKDLLNPPQYAEGLKLDSSERFVGCVDAIVNVDSNTVARLGLNKNRTIVYLTIFRNGEKIYGSSSEKESRVRVDMKEWEAFVKTLPIFTLAE